MYLLDSHTIKLHEFQSNEIPEYAILSHKWDRTEISFREMQDGRGYDMAGFTKIKGCCKQAVSDGWQYIWIDSCCIDKSSSAELSEAINSMFRWYQNAQVCYAYLSDVPGDADGHHLEGSAFCKSKWFTRGWTLQELLAPSKVVFFNHDWIEIGTKSSLEKTISSITGIWTLFSFEHACVAQKMSWASRRQTSRVEDLAYCLMGIFGVNIPPIYGEGENAFQRLQLEILNKVDDESIFAWVDAEGHSRGLLARSPAAFKYSGDVRQTAPNYKTSPYTMTNRGVRMEVELWTLGKPTDSTPRLLDREYIPPNTYLALLNCRLRGQQSDERLAINLERDHGILFKRLPNKLFSPSWNGPTKWRERQLETLYVWQPDISWYQQAEKQRETQYLFSIQDSSPPGKGYSILERHISCTGNSAWESTVDGLRLILDPSDHGTTFYGALLFTTETTERSLLMLVIDQRRWRPSAFIISTLQSGPLDEIADSMYIKYRSRQDLPLNGNTRSIGSGLTVSASMKEKTRVS